MKHILKIIKGSWITIILILILLFIQAMCDLALPEYTANIVNVGIQQSGIKDVVPEIIRATEFKNLKLLMDEKDYEEVSKYYTLDEEKTNTITYVLNEVEIEQREFLKEKFEIPIILLNLINTSNEKLVQAFKEMPFYIESDVMGPKEMISILSIMEIEQRKAFLSGFSEQFYSLEPSLVSQMGVYAIRAEYQILGLDIEAIQMNYIITTGLKMIGLALVAMIIIIITAFLSSRVAARISRDLRSKIVNKVMRFSNKEFEDLGAASLITRSTNDIQQIQLLIGMFLRLIIYAPIMGIGAFIKVSNNEMSWIIGLIVSIIIMIVSVLFAITLPRFKRLQKLVDKLNLVAREILTGLSVVRAFGTEKHEENRFGVANTDLTRAHLFVNRVMSIMMPTMMFIMNGASVLIVWVGAGKVDLGTMQVGTLMAFITYTMQIIMSFLMISMMSIMIPRAWVSIKRIGEVLDKKSSIKEAKEPKEFIESKKGVVEFKDVYFRYPDAEEDVIRKVSFIATPGTTTAFIGSTGSGKSTLINLIPRFFDVTGGQILVGGINIKEVSIHELRSKIGYIPQKGLLFSGTIKSNISFGNEQLDDEGIKRAARIAQAMEFIEEKENRFDTDISQGGSNVSGGQKQRLAIARAIAVNPDIYIFDDSFSALDYKTDSNLRKVIKEEMKNATIFIVAQRISTIMNANQIIVLDKGEVVGIGTHKELLKDCEVYKEIASSQFNKEELENG